MSDIAKTTVYITDMANFAAMNEVYKTYFPSESPARATVKADLVNRASWSRSRRSPFSAEPTPRAACVRLPARQVISCPVACLAQELAKDRRAPREEL